MEIKAYKWENSTTVELKKIQRANRTYKYSDVSNFNEVQESHGKLRDVKVLIFETRNRYNYEVFMSAPLREPVPKIQAYSSTKKCDPKVVAGELIKMFQNK